MIDRNSTATKGFSGINRLDFPHAKGSYLLVLWLAEPRTLQIGSLGELAFSAGYYLYVGSARGAGGLAARLKYHLTSTQRHWHIDSLRAAAHIQEIWLRTAEQHHECQWATLLADLPQLTRPYRGFGSSDCHCFSHLFYCSSAEALSDVRDVALKLGLARFPL